MEAGARVGDEDYTGGAVSSAGDVDNDGQDDILVGGPYYDGGQDGPVYGRAYLVLGASLGSTTEIDLTDADYFFTGEVKSDYSGRAVSSAGDVDGDGRDDILVGAIDDTSGKAYLIFSGL